MQKVATLFNMFVTNLRRIIKAGIVSFFRNGLVSFSTVFVMTLTLMLIGFLLFSNAVLNSALSQIRDKVDVNVYFTVDAPQNKIEELKSQIEKLPEVSYVKETSRKEALATFKERHKNDQLTLQAVDELGDNPFGASLAIKAIEPSQYESIANFLSQDPVLTADGSSIIEDVNYFQNKLVIERLNSIIIATERFGLAVALVFALASILITFNTVRIAIHTAREEIKVMRLVGASNMFIRGPFLVEGILYGLLASIFALMLFYPMTFYAGRYTEAWFGGINIFSYYISHFVFIFFVLTGVGILFGALSSFLAVQKYLKT